VGDEKPHSAVGRLFDRFAESASRATSEAIFFSACVALVVVWVPSYFIFGNVDTWQLVINTATTIVTFLLVALLQNAQRRSDQGMHQKLDAIAEGLAGLMEHIGSKDNALEKDIADLRDSIGAEQPE
jgi:low affinity Fe/Cu permease